MALSEREYSDASSSSSDTSNDENNSENNDGDEEPNSHAWFRVVISPEIELYRNKKPFTFDGIAHPKIV